MTLNDIFTVEKNIALAEEYSRIYAALKEKYGRGKFNSFDKRGELFENYEDRSGYAKRMHTGKIRDGIELTELELSMVCDNGYSHFGGSSVIRPDRTFTVDIFTD